MPGELLGLELRDLGELQRLGRGDDGDPLGHLERLLQLLGSFSAEELVDGSLRLLEVAADHAQPRHIEDEGDAEGHQAHDDEVQAQAAAGVRHAQRDRVILRRPGAAGGHAGVAPAVLKGDASDIQHAVLLDLPLPTCSQSTKDKIKLDLIPFFSWHIIIMLRAVGHN